MSATGKLHCNTHSISPLTMALPGKIVGPLLGDQARAPRGALCRTFQTYLDGSHPWLSSESSEKF